MHHAGGGGGGLLHTLVSYRHFTLQTFNDGTNGTEIVNIMSGYYVLYMYNTLLSQKFLLKFGQGLFISKTTTGTLFSGIVEYLFNHTH